VRLPTVSREVARNGGPKVYRAASPTLKPGGAAAVQCIDKVGELRPYMEEDYPDAQKPALTFRTPRVDFFAREELSE